MRDKAAVMNVNEERERVPYLAMLTDKSVLGCVFIMITSNVG